MADDEVRYGAVGARPVRVMASGGRRGEHWIGEVDEQSIDDDRIRYSGLHHGSSFLQHADLLATVRGSGEPLVRLEDGLWGVAVGVTAHRSIGQQRPVDLAEVLALP